MKNRWGKMLWVLGIGGILVGSSCRGEQVTVASPDPAGAPWPEAPFEVVSATVEGDVLQTVVRYGGGCGEHAFTLEADGPLMKSLPPKQPLRWVHRSPGDPCRALILDTLTSDLTPFRGSPHGTTVLMLSGWEGSLIYTYR